MMTLRNAKYFPHGVAFVAGFLVCLGISYISGRREAWDSSLYFTLGIPVMILVIFFLSRHFPVRAWRWTLAMALGQSLAMALGGNSLTLWPLAFVGMAVCSLPQFAVGFITSRWFPR